MKLLLTCTECDYKEEGSAEGGMMNKIIMWNHTQKVHPETADYILRAYHRVPDALFRTQPLAIA